MTMSFESTFNSSFDDDIDEWVKLGINNHVISWDKYIGLEVVCYPAVEDDIVLNLDVDDDDSCWAVPLDPVVASTRNPFCSCFPSCSCRSSWFLLVPPVAVVPPLVVFRPIPVVARVSVADCQLKASYLRLFKKKVSMDRQNRIGGGRRCCMSITQCRGILGN
jgi:hypothetical protein